MTDDPLSKLAPLTGRINETMKAILDEDANVLGEIAVYNLLGGGKRLRPLIFCLAHGALGGLEDAETLRLASAFEFLHMASLMHDDIVDQADTRRGRPAAHRVYGIPETVMAADYLLAKASLLALAKENFTLARIMAEVVSNLSLGELWELKARNKTDLSEADYFDIILKKTAVLIESVSWSAGVLMGAEPDVLNSLRAYGRRLGLAFQVMDDVLDYRADTSKLGKPVGQDLEEGRITLPFIIARETLNGSERARLVSIGEKTDPTAGDKLEAGFLVEKAGGLQKSLAAAGRLVDQAVEELGALPETPEKELLAKLADYTVRRDR